MKSDPYLETGGPTSLYHFSLKTWHQGGANSPVDQMTQFFGCRLTQGSHITYQLGDSKDRPEHVVIRVSCINLKVSYKGSYASP